MSALLTATFSDLPYDRREISRYCGGGTETETTVLLTDECLKELDGKIKNRICYRVFPIFFSEEGVDLGFVKSSSLLLQKQLKGCEEIVLFAATVGIDIDRLILKYGRLSPTKALLFQAIGTERVEVLCDAFEKELQMRYESQGRMTVKRVSPGYGDIPLSMQKEIFTALECPKMIGATLNDSLLISPSKSVTALIGIRKT